MYVVQTRLERPDSSSIYNSRNYERRVDSIVCKDKHKLCIIKRIAKKMLWYSLYR